MSQSKMSRLLRILMLLNSKRKYSMAELEERTQMSASTIYRYFNTFEDAGFIINRNDGLYNLKQEEKNVRELHQLFHFSEEEAYILYQTLSLLEDTSSTKERLINKLHTLYEFKHINHIHDHKMGLVSTLQNAIIEKKQVEIKDYRSSNSNKISNRVVEPFSFLDDHNAIWCYEIKDKQCKQYRLSRMASIETLANNWENEEKHFIPFCDAFRLSAAKSIATIQAVLSLKAYNLLIDEFPLSKEHIKADGKKYKLEIPVASYKGIGRFVLGLPAEVKVEGPAGFLKYLESERKKYSSLALVANERE